MPGLWPECLLPSNNISGETQQSACQEVSTHRLRSCKRDAMWWERWFWFPVHQPWAASAVIVAPHTPSSLTYQQFVKWQLQMQAPFWKGQVRLGKQFVNEENKWFSIIACVSLSSVNRPFVHGSVCGCVQCTGTRKIEILQDRRMFLLFTLSRQRRNNWPVVSSKVRHGRADDDAPAAPPNKCSWSRTSLKHKPISHSKFSSWIYSRWTGLESISW